MNRSWKSKITVDHSPTFLRVPLIKLSKHWSFCRYWSPLIWLQFFIGLHVDCPGALLIRWSFHSINRSSPTIPSLHISYTTSSVNLCSVRLINNETYRTFRWLDTVIRSSSWSAVGKCLSCRWIADERVHSSPSWMRIRSVKHLIGISMCSHQSIVWKDVYHSWRTRPEEIISGN